MLSQNPSRTGNGKCHNTAPFRRKPFVLCGMDTERKGRVSRPLTCSMGLRASTRTAPGLDDALDYWARTIHAYCVVKPTRNGDQPA
jgi:hypothetical protein